MAMQISITSTFPAVIAKLKQLPPQVGARALKRSLDRTMVTARKDMSDAIYKEYAFRNKKDVNEKLFVQKPRVSPGGLQIEASLYSRSKRGRSLNLVRFVIGDRTKNRRTGQIKLRIKRNGGIKTIPGAFLMPSKKGGSMFLARRVSKARLPIEPLQTIDIPQMFNKRTLKARVVRTIEATLGRRFDAEAKFYLARALR